MKINKEGYIIIGITGLLCLGIWSLVYLLLDTPNAVLWFMAGFLLIFWVFITAFFRNAKVKEGVHELLDNRDGLMYV